MDKNENLTPLNEQEFFASQENLTPQQKRSQTIVNGLNNVLIKYADELARIEAKVKTNKVLTGASTAVAVVSAAALAKMGMDSSTSIPLATTAVTSSLLSFMSYSYGKILDDKALDVSRKGLSAKNEMDYQTALLNGYVEQSELEDMPPRPQIMEPTSYNSLEMDNPSLVSPILQQEGSSRTAGVTIPMSFEDFTAELEALDTNTQFMASQYAENPFKIKSAENQPNAEQDSLQQSNAEQTDAGPQQ